MDNYTKLSIDKLKENLENLKKISEINANIKTKEESILLIDSDLKKLEETKGTTRERLCNARNIDLFKIFIFGLSRLYPQLSLDEMIQDHLKNLKIDNAGELEVNLYKIDKEIKSLTTKKAQKLADIESLKLEIQNLLNQEQENLENVINSLNVNENTIDNNFDEMKLKLEK